MAEFDEFLDLGGMIMPVGMDAIMGGDPRMAKIGTSYPSGGGGGGPLPEVTGGGLGLPIGMGLGALGLGTAGIAANNSNSKNKFTFGGLLERDPNKTFSKKDLGFLAANPNFAVGMNTNPDLQKQIAAASPELNTNGVPDAISGQTEMLKNRPVQKPQGIKEFNDALKDENPKSFRSKLDGVVEKIFTLQEKNPEAYSRIINGLDIYLRGQKGETIAEALYGNSKFRAEQSSALLKSAKAKADIDLTKSKTDYYNTQGMKALLSPKAKANDLALGKGLVPGIESFIKAEVFPGVKSDDENYPAAQVSAISYMLAQEVQNEINSGKSKNEAIKFVTEKAQKSGGLTKENIIKDGGFLGVFDKTIPASADVSKLKTGSTKSVRDLMAQENMTEEQAIEEIMAQGFIPR